MLVSIGRRPVTEDIGAAEAGVRLTDRGFVEVDPTTMLTSRPGVYAVGDCVNTPGLAHIAYAEAVLAVEHFLGREPGAGRLRQGPVGRLHPPRGRVVRA